MKTKTKSPPPKSPSTLTAQPSTPDDGSYLVAVQLIVSRIRHGKEQYLGAKLVKTLLPPNAPDAMVAAKCLEAYHEAGRQALAMVADANTKLEKREPIKPSQPHP